MTIKEKYGLSELAKQAISSVKRNIKEMVEKRKKGNLIDTLPEDHEFDIEKVKEAAEIKSQIDVLFKKMEALDSKYKPLREEILMMLPGDKGDKVEIMIDGIQLKKHVKYRGAGSVDHEKLMKLIKDKKLVTKLTKKVRVLDEEAVFLALAEGAISYDEYFECVKEGSLVQELKLEKRFAPGVEKKSKNQQEVI